MHILFENYVKWSVNTLVTNIFSRLNEYTSPKLSDIEYFLTTMGGFHMSLNYPYTNFKKIVCPKTSCCDVFQGLIGRGEAKIY